MLNQSVYVCIAYSLYRLHKDLTFSVLSFTIEEKEQLLVMMPVYKQASKGQQSDINEIIFTLTHYIYIYIKREKKPIHTININRYTM